MLHSMAFLHKLNESKSCFEDKKCEDALIETIALNWGTTKRAIRDLFNTIRNQKTK